MSDDDEFDDSDLPPEEQFESRTGKATAHITRLLDKYAWWSQPDQLELVKQKFLSGELSSGHPHWRSMHIRPVGYYGKSICPRYSYGDDHVMTCWLLREARKERRRNGEESPPPSHYDSDGEINPDEFDMNFHLYAFDIFDGAGRAYPLLMEYRFDVDPDAPRYVASGGLADRRTYKYLGSIESSGDSSSALTFDYECADACYSFYGWTPHSDEAMAQFVDDPYSGIYGELMPTDPEEMTWPAGAKDQWFDQWSNAGYDERKRKGLNLKTSREQAKEEAKISLVMHAQVQRIVAASLKLLDMAKRHPESATMWSAFHPPAIREMFAELALERSLSAITLGAEPVPVPGATVSHASAAAPVADNSGIDRPSVSPSSGEHDTAASTSSGSDSTLPAAAASPSSAQPVLVASASSPPPRYGGATGVTTGADDFLFDLPFVPMDPKRFVGSTDNGNGTLATAVRVSDSSAAADSAATTATAAASDASASASELDFVDDAGEKFRLDIVVSGREY